jgi:hypothetical protein
MSGEHDPGIVIHASFPIRRAAANLAGGGTALRPAVAWLGDLGRLAWGSLYWNWRKSVFRLRGAQGPAPCQHPSDSGLAGQTGCEACVGWKSTRRFRRLCPLLDVSAGGRRVCSVSAREVRPFWGRAAAHFVASAAALALAAVLVAFTAFRAVGYRVPFYAVAWPPSWHRIHQARADYYFRMALQAFSAGDVRQCYLALSQVYALDPDNARAALLLAQFTQVANPEFSDEIYARLLSGHHGDKATVAEAWFRALLARGDLASLGRLSARMLVERAEPASAWTQGVLFAERLDGNPAEVDRLLDGPAPIADEARVVLALARSVRAGGVPDRIRLLERSLGSARTPIERYYPLSCLIDLGRAADVVAVLGGPEGAEFEAYDRESLKLDAYSALGWRQLEQGEIGFLLDGPTPVAGALLIAAHLIRYPDPGAADFTFERLEARPLPFNEGSSVADIALLCAAGVNGLDQRMKQEAELLNRAIGGNFAALGRIQEFFTKSAPGRNPGVLLPALPQLPLAVVYAITAHYRAPPNPDVSPAPPESPPDGGPAPR